MISREEYEEVLSLRTQISSIVDGRNVGRVLAALGSVVSEALTCIVDEQGVEGSINVVKSFAKGVEREHLLFLKKEYGYK